MCDPGDLGAKFAAFGWDVAEADGHDLAALVDALASAKADRAGKPHALIAHTVKGKGVSFMEDQAGWHGKAPDAGQLDRRSRPRAAAPAGEGKEAAVAKLADAEQKQVKRATRAAYGATLAELAAEGCRSWPWTPT